MEGDKATYGDGRDKSGDGDGSIYWEPGERLVSHIIVIQCNEFVMVLCNYFVIEDGWVPSKQVQVWRK